MKTTFAGLFVVLLMATITGAVLARSRPSTAVTNLNARVRSWWLILIVGAMVVALGSYAAIAFFAVVSLLALDEFLAPLDSRWRRWVCYLACILHYAALAADARVLFWTALPAVALLTFHRTSAGGLLLCVYSLSFAPAMLTRFGIELVFFVVVVVQASDVLQYVWGKLCGRRAVAPGISPSKTVEGFAGGVLSAALLGAALFYLTPAGPVTAAAYAFVLALNGFFSGLAFSFLKRERGIKDWGHRLAGHGGVLDRVDSLCLTAPIAWALAPYLDAVSLISPWR